MKRTKEKTVSGREVIRVYLTKTQTTQIKNGKRCTIMVNGLKLYILPPMDKLTREIETTRKKLRQLERKRAEEKQSKKGAKK